MGKNILCARCGKTFPKEEMGNLAEQGLDLLQVENMGLPEKEQRKLYCPACRLITNIEISFLVLMGIGGCIAKIIHPFLGKR